MPESATKLEDLVGEGKKYATPDDLAKSRVEADRFIETLKAETATLREQLTLALTKADGTETLEKLMTELANKDNNVKPTDKLEIKPQDPVNQTAALTQDDIVKLIDAREAAKAEALNLAKAMAEAQKVYGDKLVESLAAKAAELGIPVTEIEALAKRSPTAFFNLIGLNQREGSTRPLARGGQVHQPATPHTGVRNKAYYEDLRKTMGTTKFILDTQLQAQMHRDLVSDSWE